MESKARTLATVQGILAAFLFVASCTEQKPIWQQREQKASFERIQIFVDTSGSLGEEEYRSTKQFVCAALDTLVEIFSARYVSVIPFSAGPDLWSGSHVTAVLPEPPVIEVRADVQNEAALLFRKYQAKLQKEAEEEKKRARLNARGAYVRAVRDSVAPVSMFLAGLRQGDAECTSLNDLAVRCGSDGSNTLSLVITDGVDDCGMLSHESVEEAEGTSITVFFLVPTKRDSQRHGEYGELLKARGEALRRLLPSAIVLPSYMSSRLDSWLGEIVQKRMDTAGSDWEDLDD